MGRQERKNMIEFIQRTEQYDQEYFMYMTDEDIEYLYNRIYFDYENIE